jgi:hypothetical protein
MPYMQETSILRKLCIIFVGTDLHFSEAVRALLLDGVGACDIGEPGKMTIFDPLFQIISQDYAALNVEY